MRKEPIDPAVAEKMKEVGLLIASALPATHGFCLLVFDFGKEGRMNYMSNANREQMLVALKEFIRNVESTGP